MAEKSREQSYLQEAAEKGAFIVLWGKEWGVSVYPAYGIDKVKFSFIDLGAKGKGKSFDIYMDTIHDGTQCFDNWAYDILHGTMTRVLAAEAQAGEKYPKAYNYVTGETADKSVGIGNANTKGKYVINGSITVSGKKIFANVQAGFHDLRRLAEFYQYSYEDRKRQIAQQCVTITGKYHENRDENRTETVQETPKVEAAPKATPKAEEKAKAAPVEKTSSKKEAADSKALTIRVKTLTPITYMSNNKDLALKVVTENGDTKNLLFLADVTGKVDGDTWSNFLSKTHVEGYTFKGVFTTTSKGSLVFQKFAA